MLDTAATGPTPGRNAPLASPLLQPLLAHLRLSHAQPLPLAFTPPQGFDPRVLNCHLNVWCQVRRHGGQAQHGWILDHLPEQELAEAVFHTVWRAPDGALHDVTPRVDRAPQLLFVPDERRRIQLAEHEGQPAILTYNTVRFKGTKAVAPLRRIQIVMDAAFATQQGLWPW